MSSSDLPDDILAESRKQILGHLRTTVESQGHFHSQKIYEALSRSRDIKYEPNRWWESALQVISWPEEKVGQLIGTLLAPEGYKEKFKPTLGFATEHFAEQPTSVDAILSVLDKTRAPEMSPEFVGAFGAGLVIDFFANPLSFAKAGRVSRLQKAAELAVRSAGTTDKSLALASVKDWVKMGLDPIPVDAALMKKAVAGDTNAIRAVDNLKNYNRILSEAILADKSVELTAPGKLQQIQKGQTTLMSFSGEPGRETTRFEKELAHLIEGSIKAGKAVKEHIVNTIPGIKPLMGLFDGKSHIEVIQKAREVLQQNTNVKREDLFQQTIAFYGKTSKADRDKLLKAAEIVQKPFIESKDTVAVAQLDELMDLIKGDAWENIPKLSNKVTDPFLDMSDEAREFISPRGIEQGEANWIIKNAPSGKKSVGILGTRQYHVISDLDKDQFANTAVFLERMKNVPGIGQTALDLKTSKLIVKAINPVSDPAKMDFHHLDNLERILAVAANRGYGVDSAIGLQDAVSFGKHGIVQITDPTIFKPFGLGHPSLKESRLSLERFLETGNHRVGYVSDLLDDARAVKVKPNSIRIRRPNVDDFYLENLRDPEAAKQIKGAPRSWVEDNAANLELPEHSATLQKSIEEFSKTGKIQPVEIAFDDWSASMWIANRPSMEALALAKQMDVTDIPIRVVDFVGDNLEHSPVGFIRSQKMAKGAVVNNPISTATSFQHTRSLLQNPKALSAADDLVTLQKAGFTPDHIDELSNSLFMDSAGNVVLSYESLAGETKLAIQNMKRRFEQEIRKVYTRKLKVTPEIDAAIKEAVDGVFPPRAKGGYDVDADQLRKFIKGIPRATSTKQAWDHKVFRGILQTLEDMDDKFARIQKFLKDGDPRGLGFGHISQITPKQSKLQVKQLGLPIDPVVSMHNVAKYAGEKGLHPETMVVVDALTQEASELLLKRGALSLPQPVAAPIKELAVSLPTAIETISSRNLTKGLLKSRIKGPFIISKAKEKELLDKGIHINPSGVIPERMRDEELHVIMFSPANVNLVLAENWHDVKKAGEEVWGTLPTSFREFGSIRQGEVKIFRLRFTPLERITPEIADAMTERIKAIASKVKEAGAHPSWRFNFTDDIGIDPVYIEELFGKNHTIADVLSPSWKVKVTKELENKTFDLYDVVKNVRYTWNESADATINEIVAGYRDLTHGKWLDEEIKAGLLAPHNLIWGYLDRTVTPAGQKSIDDFWEALGKERPGKWGKVYDYAKSQYRKRKLTHLTHGEVNDIWRYGHAHGVDVEDILKVKVTLPGQKSKTSIQEMLKTNPEDLAFFMEDIRRSAMWRRHSAIQAIENKRFIDTISDQLALPIGPKGETWITPKQLAKAKENPTTDWEAKIKRLVSVEGAHYTVIDINQARKLAADGVLNPEVLKAAHGQAFMKVEGALMERAHRIRFLPREYFEEANRVYSSVTSVKEVNAALKAAQQITNLWIGWTLFTVPKTLVRNMVSNTLMAATVGLDPTDIGTYREAAQTLAGYKGLLQADKRLPERAFSALLSRIGPKNPMEEVVTKTGEIYTRKALVEQANKHGVFHNSYVAQFDDTLNDMLEAKGILPLSKMKVFNPFDVNNVAVRFGRKIHTGMEDWTRFAVFLKNVKEGKTIEEAAMLTKKGLGRFEDFSDFERKVLKNLVPFYGWLRWNIPRQAQWLIENPEQVMNMARMIGDIGRGGANVPQEHLPEWMWDKYKINFGKMKDGTYGVFVLDGFLPFTDLMRFLSPVVQGLSGEGFTSGLEGFLDMGVMGLNPLYKTPIEAVTNRSTFTGRDLEEIPGELSSQTNLPDLTRRMTAKGPLGVGNLLWNEQVLDQLRPFREWGKIAAEVGVPGLGDIYKGEDSSFQAWTTFLFGKAYNVDPDVQIAAANRNIQGQYNYLRSKLRKATEAGDTRMIDWIQGQINRLSVQFERLQEVR